MNEEQALRILEIEKQKLPTDFYYNQRVAAYELAMKCIKERILQNEVR